MSIAVSRTTTRDPFVLLVGALLFGYLLMSRTFAHWGVKPFFIGEMALAAFLFAKPVSLLRPWLTSLVVPSQLSAFSWALLISLFYGVLQCMRALIADPRTALLAGEIFVFHLYPLYFFPGLWVGRVRPNYLRRVMLPLGWAHGIYGLLYILVFSPLGWTQSPSYAQEYGWVGHPCGTPLVMLGLLALEPSMKRAAIPLLMNLLVLVGMQRRAEWVALICGLILWAYLAGRMRQLGYCALFLFTMLLIGLLPGVKFPSPAMRGESMSSWDVIGRMISPFNAELARKLMPNADDQAATAHWRTDFWKAIWQEMNTTELRTLFGLGYAFPISELHPEEPYENPVRTPHNILVFALGYSGWIGLFIYLALQATLARLMWRVYRITGEPFGICLWLIANIWAVIDPLLERPFGGIPIYLLFGLAVAEAYTAIPKKSTAATELPEPAAPILQLKISPA